MGKPGFDLDALARSVTTSGRTRRTLVAVLAGAATLVPALSLDVDAKRKKKKKKCKFSPKCGGECCSPDRCFEKVGVSSGTATEFACCPLQSLSINPRGPGSDSKPDQCCYPDETPMPSLANNILADMLCCRPCPGVGDCFEGEGWLDGCIIQSQYECIEGQCALAETARLPRVRR